MLGKRADIAAAMGNGSRKSNVIEYFIYDLATAAETCALQQDLPPRRKIKAGFRVMPR